MNYYEAREYIKGLGKRGISPGLKNEQMLLDKLGNPEKKLKIIHVAGTNGKGSFGAYLDSIIREAGMCPARFISPCVGEYLSTYSVNNKSVSSNDFIECVEKVRSATDSLERDNIFITSFEAETAIAFLLFEKSDPDYVILECGMGGASDATNVIPPPCLTVFTSISLDHTAFLGSTYAEITEQKAGIIKTDSKVVTTRQINEVYEVIKKKCAEKGVALYVSDKPQKISYSALKTNFFIDGTEYETSMLGSYQPENATLAICAAKILGIDNKPIQEGIKKATWAYRFEKIGKFILDGAHNPGGAKALAESLSIYHTECDTVFICACFKDKDFDSIAKITSSFSKKVFCIKAPTDRGLQPEILCNAFRKYGVDSCVSDSLKEAIHLASAHKRIVIFGTLSILDEAKNIINQITEGTHYHGAV